MAVDKNFCRNDIFLLFFLVIAYKTRYNIRCGLIGMNKGYYIISFFKNNVVLVVAFVAAAVSCIFIPPDAGYADYFDLRTLISLFGMSAVVAALKNLRFFRILAAKIISLFKTTRSAISALVAITYIASMLIANDMALITFLPLGYFVLHSSKQEKHMAFTFTMQTVAANLGGMLTPFGNPQNLYLYNKFRIPTSEFFGIMIFPTLFSVLLIALCCLFIKKETLEKPESQEGRLNKTKTAFCFAFFAYMLLIVFRVVPYWTGLLIIPVMLIFDRTALGKVDYSLLLTFCMFFIFTGNLSRLDAVDSFFRVLLGKSVLLTGVVSCQLISNVPSAVLLSGFTADYAALLTAVNIGGCGTLISSMASLISFKCFCAYRPREKGKYLLLNSAVNLGFLIALTLFCLLLPLF